MSIIESDSCNFTEVADENEINQEKRLRYYKDWLSSQQPLIDISRKQFLSYEKKGFVFPHDDSEAKECLKDMKIVRRKLRCTMAAEKSKQNQIQTAVHTELHSLMTENDQLRAQNAHQNNTFLKLYNVMLAAASILGTIPGYNATSENEMKTNFVFKKLTAKPTYYNQERHLVIQDIYPCGFLRAMDKLDEIIRRHEQICNTSWSDDNILENKNRVKAYNDYYIMLPSSMTYEEGLRACQALDTSLAEVRTNVQKEQFISLMLGQGQTVSFAGLAISDRESSLIYQSDGEAVDSKTLDNEFFTTDNEPILWDDFMNKNWRHQKGPEQGEGHPRSQHFMFQYTVFPRHVQMARKRPKELIINPITDTHIRRDMPLTIMCNRPVIPSTDPIDWMRFESNCWEGQTNLDYMTTGIKLRLNKLLPGKLNDFYRPATTNNNLYKIIIDEDETEQETLAEICQRENAYPPTTSTLISDFGELSRDGRSLTPFSEINPLYSILDFALKEVARPIVRHVMAALFDNSDQRHSSKDGDNNDDSNDNIETNSLTPNPSEPLYAEKFREQIDRYRNNTALMIHQQKLNMEAMQVFMLVKMATINLDAMIDTDEEIPLSRIWSEETYEAIRKQLEDRKTMLARDMSTATFTISRTSKAFHVEYRLPLLERKRRAHIFQVQSLPLIYHDKAYHTAPYSDFMAVDIEKEHFMPMTPNEAAKCQRGTCIISSQLIEKSNDNYCGLDAYFHARDDIYSNQKCQYDVNLIEDEDRPSRFISIGNTTYFSVADNSSIEMKCRKNDDTKITNYYLHGLGFFTMPKNCEAKVDNMVIKQAKTTLPSDKTQSDNMAIINVVSPAEDLIQRFIREQDNSKEHVNQSTEKIRWIAIILAGTVTIMLICCLTSVIFVVRKKKMMLQKKKSIVANAELQTSLARHTDKEIGDQSSVIDIPILQQSQAKQVNTQTTTTAKQVKETIRLKAQ